MLTRIIRSHVGHDLLSPVTQWRQPALLFLDKHERQTDLSDLGSSRPVLAYLRQIPAFFNKQATRCSAKSTDLDMFPGAGQPSLDPSCYVFDLSELGIYLQHISGAFW